MRVIVTLDGGLIQDIIADEPIDDILVIDYDCDGVDEELTRDIDGTECFISRWGSSAPDKATKEYVDKEFKAFNTPEED